MMRGRARGREAARALRIDASRYEAAFLAQEARVDDLQLYYRAAAAKYAEAEAAPESAGAGFDAEGRARKTRRHANDRCRTPHDRRSHRPLVPLYGTGEGSVVLAETRSDRRCLFKRSGFSVRRFRRRSLSPSSSALRQCIGVLPKYQRP